MTQYTWFRVYNEIRTDSKIRRLTPAERWVFIGLMCLANEGRERGTIELAPGMPYETPEIADGMGVSVEIVKETLEKAEKLNMIECRPDGVIIITNMKKRQYQSDSSTGRVRKHREKKRAQRFKGTLSGNVPETFQQTVSETHQTRTEHSRAKKDAPLSFWELLLVCKLDEELLTEKQRKELWRAANTLEKQREPEHADFEKFERWWYAVDWRGKKGDTPRPSQVQAEWSRFEKWRKESAGQWRKPNTLKAN